MRFRTFLLNEDRAYLGQRVGDVLTALSDLNQHGKSIGSRQLIASAEGIANQIRRILHSSWPKEEVKFLYPLQKCGAAIMKAIEEKDDLASVLASAEAELGKLSGDLGVPVNNLATPQAPKVEPKPMAPPQEEEKKPPVPQEQPDTTQQAATSPAPQNQAG